MKWHHVADLIAQVAEQAVADPNHPWTVRWPTSMDMAGQIGTNQATVLKALYFLADEQEWVKAWVPRQDGAKELWVPKVRALAGEGFRSRPTDDQIAAEILLRHRNGQWRTLPSQYILAEHFRVSRARIYRVMLMLAERRQAVKVRDGAHHRWRIIQPHNVRTIDPRLTVRAHRPVVHDLIRRIRDGEFRYRLPDGSVHEQPFLANREILEQYAVSSPTVTNARKELVALGWIVPGSAPNQHYRVAERVPPIDRPTHPPGRKARKPSPRNKRAREIADDVIARIRGGEFTCRAVLGQVELMAEYEAGRFNVIAAFRLLKQEGWLTFRNTAWGDVAELVDPLPEQPHIWLATRVEDLGLSVRTLNCLRREGIATVGEIAARTDHELLAIRNLGVTSLRELKRALGFEAEQGDQARAG